MRLRCYEAKIEGSEKAGSRRESNPGHLWLEPPVLCHWAMTAGQPPTLTILYVYFTIHYVYFISSVRQDALSKVTFSTSLPCIFVYNKTSLPCIFVYNSIIILLLSMCFCCRTFKEYCNTSILVSYVIAFSVTCCVLWIHNIKIPILCCATYTLHYFLD